MSASDHAVGGRGALVWVVLALALAGCRPPSPAPGLPGTTWLEVEVRGLEAEAGKVALALFGSAESFGGGEPSRRVFLPADGGVVVWRLDGLAPGDYALKAYHDLDGSGELEVDFFGAPTEPYGFSNGARGAFGPPGWRAARFRLGPAGARIAVAVE